MEKAGFWLLLICFQLGEGCNKGSNELPIEGSGAMLNLEPMSHNRFSLCALGDRSIGVKGDIALGVSQFEIFISIETMCQLLTDLPQTNS